MPLKNLRILAISTWLTNCLTLSFLFLYFFLFVNYVDQNCGVSFRHRKLIKNVHLFVWLDLYRLFWSYRFNARCYVLKGRLA